MVTLTVEYMDGLRIDRLTLRLLGPDGADQLDGADGAQVDGP
jgi:hypothetical protein